MNAKSVSEKCIRHYHISARFTATVGLIVLSLLVGMISPILYPQRHSPAMSITWESMGIVPKPNWHARDDVASMWLCMCEGQLQR